jgi:hypothetical protein
VSRRFSLPNEEEEMLRRTVSAVVVLGLIGAACVLGGCAAGTCAWGDLDTGLVLEYRMPEGKALPYKLTSDFTQNLDAMGQQITIESTQLLAFSVAPGKPDGEVQPLDITIDGMNVSISSPQGDQKADVDDVVGESFTMTLSAIGEESGLPDHGALQYDVGPDGPRSIIPAFETMFPDLPGYPVVIGDSWPSSVEVVEKNEGSEVAISMDIVNTFDGYEKIAGYDCAKIVTETTGRIVGTGTQMGATWSTDADMLGTGVWYFAYKEGFFVKEFSEGTADGSIIVDAPDQQLEMPMTRVFAMVSELTK